jgi:hypothetical protein
MSAQSDEQLLDHVLESQAQLLVHAWRQREALIKCALELTQTTNKKRRARAERNLMIVVAYCAAYDQKNPFAKAVVDNLEKVLK